MIKSIPYWRISLFYLFYFASLGAFVPYWGLYLQSLGFDARTIGEFMAIVMGTKIIAPYIWGWIADHTGKGMLIIRVATICSAFSFIGVFLGDGYWWLVIIMTLFSFFWNAQLPQFEVNTINHLGSDTHRYSTIRLWGSLGFILSVVLLGAWLDAHDISVVPVVVLALYVLIAISSFTVPEKKNVIHANHEGVMVRVLKQPVVIAVLAVCFLAQLAHASYYTFFSIYLRQHNYDNTVIGSLWALGVIAEIVVFVFMYRLMPVYGPRNLLLLALGLTGLRWFLIGHYVDYFSILLFAQTLHAASFGLYHAVSIELFHRLFKGRLQGRGQALYSSISFGAGGAVGSFLSGILWDNINSTFVFNFSAAVAVVAMFVTWKYIKSEHVKST